MGTWDDAYDDISIQSVRDVHTIPSHTKIKHAVPRPVVVASRKNKSATVGAKNVKYNTRGPGDTGDGSRSVVH